MHPLAKVSSVDSSCLFWSCNGKHRITIYVTNGHCHRILGTNIFINGEIFPEKSEQWPDELWDADANGATHSCVLFHMLGHLWNCCNHQITVVVVVWSGGTSACKPDILLFNSCNFHANARTSVELMRNKLNAWFETVLAAICLPTSWCLCHLSSLDDMLSIASQVSAWAVNSFFLADCGGVVTDLQLSAATAPQRQSMRETFSLFSIKDYAIPCFALKLAKNNA